MTEMSAQSRPCYPFVFTFGPACSEHANHHTTYAAMFFLVLTFLLVLPISSPAAQSLWEAMLTSKHKEGVMEVRRQLVEAASREKLPIKMGMGKLQQSTQSNSTQTTQHRNLKGHEHSHQVNAS